MAETARRDFLKLALAGAFAAAGAALDSAQVAAETLGAPTPFAPDDVLALAQNLAKAPFKPPNSAPPDPFGNLTFEQYSVIRRVVPPIWSDAHSPFALEPLQRGFLYTSTMDLFLVEGGQAQHVLYDRSAFDFGKLQVPATLPDIGFSGVRITSGGGAEGWSDMALFQGATFFRSLAKGQVYGVTARGLSIRTGDPQGEEFPIFRGLWIERPGPAADSLVIHALLDSASLTGAYRFTLRTHEATIIDTELTLFARAAIDHLGLGAMSASYLSGPLDHHRVDDIRPQVHEVSGLQMLTGVGEWLWRPVANRDSLQVSGFADKSPRGFGLLQRNRSFESFGDDEAHWEIRPSLWIEPIGEWRDGQFVLIEIPSDSENNNNIIVQWRPNVALAPGQSVSFAYRQFWCWTPPARPDLAIATSSRMGRIGKRRRFAVEFTADAFADARVAAEAAAEISASPGQIASYKIYPYKERKVVRVVFDLDPGSESFSELRLVLKAQNKPVSETWLFRWTA